MKEKLIRLASYLLVAVLASFATLAVAMPGGPDKLDQLEDLIQERFIGQAEEDAMQDAAAAAMVAATGDRWSYYIPASEYAAYVEQKENAYVGVGITIQRDEEEEGFRILSVAPGGPAEEAGLAVGDLVIEVDSQNVRELDVQQLRALVQGKEGTTVSIRVLRKGEGISFWVERRRVETVVATHEMLEQQVGLVTIANFDERCAEETIGAIETLLKDGAQALIFDVRGNPGGYADELVEVLDYLLPEGELFRTVRYDGKEHVDMSGEDFLDVPMAVLVNGDSYSAAEFFAAALREYGAAFLVGEQTVGKGYFQTTYQLSDGSAVALSIGKYYTPKGVNLSEEGGLTPDWTVELDDETAEALYYGTLEPKDDPQIQKALEELR